MSVRRSYRHVVCLLAKRVIIVMSHGSRGSQNMTDCHI